MSTSQIFWYLYSYHIIPKFPPLSSVQYLPSHIFLSTLTPWMHLTVLSSLLIIPPYHLYISSLIFSAISVILHLPIHPYSLNVPNQPSIPSYCPPYHIASLFTRSIPSHLLVQPFWCDVPGQLSLTTGDDLIPHLASSHSIQFSLCISFQSKQRLRDLHTDLRTIPRRWNRYSRLWSYLKQRNISIYDSFINLKLFTRRYGNDYSTTLHIVAPNIEWRAKNHNWLTFHIVKHVKTLHIACFKQFTDFTLWKTSILIFSLQPAVDVAMVFGR